MMEPPVDRAGSSANKSNRDSGAGSVKKTTVSESDALLVEEEPVPVDMCQGLIADWHDSEADAHALLFLLALWVSCNLESLAQARATSRAWRDSKAVTVFAPLYWPCWLGLVLFNFLGRATLRVAVCNQVPLMHPRADESAREFEIRAFWVVPISGWFAIVFLGSIVEIILVPLGNGEHPFFSHMNWSNARLYTGAITRAIVAGASTRSHAPAHWHPPARAPGRSRAHTLGGVAAC